MINLKFERRKDLSNNGPCFHVPNRYYLRVPLIIQRALGGREIFCQFRQKDDSCSSATAEEFCDN